MCAGRYELQPRQRLLSFICSSVTAGKGGIANGYTVFVTKSRYRWEDVRDTGCEDVGRFVLLQWQALVDTTMALRFHTRRGISWLGKRLSGSQGLCSTQSDGRCVSCVVWRRHCWYEDSEMKATLKRECGIFMCDKPLCWRCTEVWLLAVTDKWASFSLVTCQRAWWLLLHVPKHVAVKLYDIYKEVLILVINQLNAQILVL